jgi:hypothetical protein
MGWSTRLAAATLFTLVVCGPGQALAFAQDLGDRLAERLYTAEDAADFLSRLWKLNVQPTYERKPKGTSTGYLLLQPYLRFDLGVLLWTRFEWPVPQVDDTDGSTTAGVGDLQWLNLVGLAASERWGSVGIGPVFVFPAASSSEMGQGKYQAGPAVGYVNRAVKGWQFALLLQQFFSFAGDPDRPSVNELKLQPYITKLLGDSWYVQTKPAIELNFAKGTSTVPLDLVIGTVVDGRWSLYLEATVYPGWTSPPTTDYRLTLNVGYLFPSPLSRP